MRRRKWKLYEFSDGQESHVGLYGLNEDPEESTDLSDLEEFQPVRYDLYRRLRQKWNPLPALKKTQDLDAAHHLLSKWGQKVKPFHPDSITLPDTELEKDVELVK